jgi:hypothetical protein
MTREEKRQDTPTIKVSHHVRQEKRQGQGEREERRLNQTKQDNIQTQNNTRHHHLDRYKLARRRLNRRKIALTSKRQT